MKPQISREEMRRACALFLLLLFVGPWLLALSPFNATGTASLPVCCRAHGKHKCFLRLSGVSGDSASTGDKPAFSRVSERCPYKPAWTNTPHSKPFGQSAKDIRWIGHSSPAVTGCRRNAALHLFLIARELEARATISSPFAQNHDRQARDPTEVAISLEARCTA